MHSVRSRIGPQVTRRVFRIVKFVEATIASEPSFSLRLSSLISRSSSKTRRIRVAKAPGGTSNSAFEGCSRSVVESYLPQLMSHAMDSRWKPMPWARHYAEQLGTRQDEIEYLRDEEQDERFGEMSLEGNGCECHTREVAERVPRECFGRIPGMSMDAVIALPVVP